MQLLIAKLEKKNLGPGEKELIMKVKLFVNSHQNIIIIALLCHLIAKMNNYCTYKDLFILNLHIVLYCILQIALYSLLAEMQNIMYCICIPKHRFAFLPPPTPAPSPPPSFPLTPIPHPTPPLLFTLHSSQSFQPTHPRWWQLDVSWMCLAYFRPSRPWAQI